MLCRTCARKRGNMFWFMLWVFVLFLLAMAMIGLLT